MAQIGSTQGIISQSLTATVDQQGNQIISSDTSFGASPAGYALLGQQLFGLPNGSFNLTPSDVYSNLGSDNRLPYWDWAEYSDGTMTATPTYDSTTQTWGIKINPGTAASGDYCTLTTRSYLLNDDNLGLRQKAFAVISKGGTAAASTQWGFALNAIYYDTTNNPIGTAAVGTVLDTGTWSSISGYTTTNGSAIPASAKYVELQFKLTATAAVTGSATVTIKSCLLSSKIGANSSFLITETFTSSTTWTVPTGVTSLVAVAMTAAGGGGAGGGIAAVADQTLPRVSGGGGGGGGAPYSLTTNVDLAGATSVTIGIGAGGAGGAGTSFTKAAAATTSAALVGSNGAAGGATTFAFGGTTFITLTGGDGGTAGISSVVGSACVRGGGGAAGAYSPSSLFFTTSQQTNNSTGGRGGSATTSAAFSEAGNVGAVGTQDLIFPYVPTQASVAGGTVTTSGTAVTFTTGAAGTAVANKSLSGGGGGASSVAGTAAVSAAGAVGGSGGAQASAGGAAGASGIAYITGGGSGTVAITAGNGGTAPNYGAGGGGAGGNAIVTGTTNYNARAISAASGKGGNGANGMIVIAYIA